jgi:hypothetical protein
MMVHDTFFAPKEWDPMCFEAALGAQSSYTGRPSMELSIFEAVKFEEA